jgi:transglutaminase-like putative cysteine protease
VTYGREKRLLLGCAALLAPLPLPLNDMLEWPALAVYLVAIVAFLRRAASSDRAERWLQKRSLNFLGLVYLPLLVFDVGFTGRAQLLRPMLHLTLFVVAVKLWSLTEEKHKWQAWIGIFFLFLASMATSVHPSVVLFLAGFVALTIVVLLRFVYLHALAAFGHREGPAPKLPVRAFAATTVLATLVLAVPLFALLPRVRAPYIMGPGGSGQGELARAGFSDEMSLDLIGRIRDNQQVAMRLAFTGRTPPPGAMRFKAATYDLWEGRRWRRSERARALLRDPREALFRLAPGRADGSATIYLEPLRSTSLIVPMEALTVDLQLAAVDVDEGGALTLRGMPDEILEYRVSLGAREISLAAPPRPPAARAAAASPALPAELDRSGLTPRMAALAAEWAGQGTDIDRARRIERHFVTEFGYTREFIGRGGESPLENFLFEARRGHCEYFASSMVMLLRAQGIPARLVTGFLGAEYSAWERAWIVRQSNAHAWVEGFVGGQGWIAFDPTPPAGRPQMEPESLLTLSRQAWEFITFRWDRYVISFDFYDQIGLLFNMRSFWDRLMRDLFAATTRNSPPDAAGVSDAGTAAAPPPGAPKRANFLVWALGVALFGFLVGALLLLHKRDAWTRTRAYRALVATLRGSGLAVPDWAGPLRVAELAGERFPAALPASTRIVRGYLRESFAGEASREAELAEARRDLLEVEAAIRATRAAMKYSQRSSGRRSGESAGPPAAGGKRA